MTRMRDAIKELYGRGEAFALVSIQEGHGSMPRHQGAQMLVRGDGSIEGSIGGGILEANAIRAAMDALRDRRNVREHFDLSNRDAANSEMICGGSGVLDIRCYGGEDTAALLEAMEAADRGTMYIFGGGHVGKAIAAAAEIAEIPTVVVEDRAEFVTAERFPHSKRLTVPDYGQIPAMELTEQDMVVIVTRGHLGDREALHWALDTRAGYIGMIGSRRKRDLMYERMEEEGTPRSAFARVKCPIGLSIGAQTPGEIAIAVLAEIVAVRYGV